MVPVELVKLNMLPCSPAMDSAATHLFHVDCEALLSNYSTAFSSKTVLKEQQNYAARPTETPLNLR